MTRSITKIKDLDMQYRNKKIMSIFLPSHIHCFRFYMWSPV